MKTKYGIAKCHLASSPELKSTPPKHNDTETQYHLHSDLDMGDGGNVWDSAINVGTDNPKDLLNYKLVDNFNHPVLDALRQLPMGWNELTGTNALPALDFLRSDILNKTGPWLPGSVMDASGQSEPCQSIKQLLERVFNGTDANGENASTPATVYIFGRPYNTDFGVHDIHMNQGSRGHYFNDGGKTDHNEIWQDGAVLVDFADPNNPGWVAYFTSFTQQTVPCDDLGNPQAGGHAITDADDGSLIPGA